MTSVLDLWRGVDPATRLVSGDPDALRHPVRGVARTRAVAPHLPPLADGQLLIADATVVADLDDFLAAVADAGLAPSAVWVAGAVTLQRAADALPVLVGDLAPADVLDRARRYLEDEAAVFATLTAELRLAGAEAALADPRPSAPAGVAAARLRRGVAVASGGALVALHARSAGRALASRFSAAHVRLLGTAGGDRAARRTADGLWVLARQVGDAATAWLFDDLPFARVDEIGLEALAVTLRALFRRRPAEPARGRREPAPSPSTGDPLRDTLIAVARANGRINPAARALGVHRNTVRYRLQRAAVELGIDPRRPEDALRLLRGREDR
jgi:hypothetical protein